MIKLSIEENRPKPDQTTLDKLNLEIFGDFSKIPLTFSDYKEYVSPLISAKKSEMENSDFAKEITKKIQDTEFEE